MQLKHNSNIRDLTLQIAFLQVARKQLHVYIYVSSLLSIQSFLTHISNCYRQICCQKACEWVFVVFTLLNCNERKKIPLLFQNLFAVCNQVYMSLESRSVLQIKSYLLSILSPVSFNITQLLTELNHDLTIFQSNNFLA